MRKSHQIPVESLVSYLNNELGLKQEGDLNYWKLYYLSVIWVVKLTLV